MLEGNQVPTEYSVWMLSGWKLAAGIDKSANSWEWNIDKQQADRFLQCKIMRDETLDYQSRRTCFLKVVLVDSKVSFWVGIQRKYFMYFGETRKPETRFKDFVPFVQDRLERPKFIHREIQQTRNAKPQLD